MLVSVVCRDVRAGKNRQVREPRADCQQPNTDSDPIFKGLDRYLSNAVANTHLLSELLILR